MLARLIKCDRPYYKKSDLPYVKKRDRPSVRLNLLSQTIDQRQAALDATHSIAVRDRKSRNSRKLLNIVSNKSCLTS